MEQRPGTAFSLEVIPRLPTELGRLEELANNLWFSWNRAARGLFARLDPELWDALEHSPKALLGRFTILNGTRAGEKLGLGGSGIRIGRESTICEIVLENPKVSRLHAEVVSIDGKVLLIDRNSSNGTYVNDHKIDKRFLQDGDIIYFGGRNAVAVAFHA